MYEMPYKVLTCLNQEKNKRTETNKNKVRNTKNKINKTTKDKY